MTTDRMKLGWQHRDLTSPICADCESQDQGRFSTTVYLLYSEFGKDFPRKRTRHRIATIRNCCAKRLPVARVEFWKRVLSTIQWAQRAYHDEGWFVPNLAYDEQAARDCMAYLAGAVPFPTEEDFAVYRQREVSGTRQAITIGAMFGWIPDHLFESEVAKQEAQIGQRCDRLHLDLAETSRRICSPGPLWD